MTPGMIGIIVLCILAVVFAPPLWSVAVDYGVPLIRATFRRFVHFRWHGLLSSIADDENTSFDDENMAISVDETNSETAETPQRVAENYAETFTLGETTALARLVASGKIGLTDAVKIGADAKSGEKYQKRSREIRAAVDKMQNKFPQRTPEQEAVRRQLGIEKR